MNQGRSQDLGGGANFFFRFGNLHVARGVWGHAPPRKFFKIVQFGVYLDQISTLKFFRKVLFFIYFFLNYHFLYKILKTTIFYIKNKYFRYTLATG